jgi:hypothetical protein
MLNSEVGRYQLQDRLNQAQRERIAASVSRQPSRRIQRVSTALFGRVRLRKPATVPARATRAATVG